MRIQEHDSATGPYVTRCIEEAGGSMPLREFLEKFQKRFNHRPAIYSNKMANTKSLKGLLINNGVVRLPADMRVM